MKISFTSDHVTEKAEHLVVRIPGLDQAVAVRHGGYFRAEISPDGKHAVFSLLTKKESTVLAQFSVPFIEDQEA